MLSFRRLLHPLLAILAATFAPTAHTQTTYHLPLPIAVGSAAAPVQVTLSAVRGGTVDAIRTRTLGSDAFDFLLVDAGTCGQGTNLAAGQQCTLTLGFAATAPGERRGAIVLLDRSGGVLATRLLDAQATGPLGTFVPGKMSTVAGDTVWIYAGDGGPATQSSIFLPFGIAIDAAGNLYIADSSNNRIRKVDAVSGLISTIAGSGIIGGTGDGGPALQATLSNPMSIALDPTGNVYFSDSGNNSIRRIDAFNGSISTVAGKAGTHGYGGDGGPATLATLNTPNGITFDAAGNLLLADTGNHVIRRIDAESGIISTIAGRGTPAFGGDGGPATTASLNSPWSVTVAGTGEIYIADQNNHCIREVLNGGVISTVAGTGIAGFAGDKGPANAAQFNAPASVVIDVAGNLYIADSGNNRVRKVNAQTGVVNTVAGDESESISGDDGPADQAGLYGPYTLALDGQGNLFIADVFHNRIRKVSANAAVLLFPPMRVGRVAPAQTQKFENDGNAPLHPASVLAVNDAKVDGTLTTCTPSSTLAPLTQCIVGASFSPTQIGPQVKGAIDANSDAANSPGVLTVQGQVLTIDPSTVTLASSANPSITGASVTFTVTVSSAGTTPTGTVSLLDGTSTLGVTQLGPAGTGTFKIATLTGGQHSLTSTYAGDTSNSSGASSILVQIVKDQVAATGTTLSASATRIDAGAPLKLTAQVAVQTAGSGSGTIAGSVAFMDGATQIGTAAVTNGTAVLTTALGVGTHRLTAVYGGSANYGTSTSPPLVETVDLATTRISIASANNPANAGAPLALTATVLSSGGIAGGQVTFFDGPTALGSATLDPSGIASFPSPGAHWTVGAHTLSAAYAGDANDGPSNSLALIENVQLAKPGIKVASSLNPAGYGANITFTAVALSNGGMPTGAVQFLEGATVLGTASLDATGAAVLTSNSLSIGAHDLHVAYAGDAFNGAAFSQVLTQVVTQTNIAALIASSKNPSVFGDPLTLTASVTGTGSTPSGAVTFFDGAATLGTAQLDPIGHTQIFPAGLALGSHQLTVAYAGDKYHAAVTSTAISQTIVQGTTTMLNASATHSFAGSSLQWTATVTGASGQPVTGAVNFLDGNSTLAKVTPSAAGVAQVSTSSMAPGQHIVVAHFEGDAANAPSDSIPFSVTIDVAVTQTLLVTSANPSNSAAPLTLQATVTGNGGTPSGQVNFLDGAVVLATQTLSANGLATLTLSTLAPGIHTLTASYLGDHNDQPGLSPAIAQQVIQHTGLTLTSSVNPSLMGDSVTLTLSASNGATTGAAPTGSVTLTDNGAVAGSATLTSSGLASFLLPGLTVGQHSFAVGYAGDNANSPATSAPLVQNVSLRPTTNTFTSSAASITAGMPVVFVSVVLGTGSRPPTGLVTFASGNTVLGSAAINAAGVATLSITPGEGSYSVVASYAGDTLFAPSNSAPIALTVGPTVSFLLSSTPSSLSMQSGQHGSLMLNLTTARSFTDTLALGCAGLPASATCTFSTNQIAVAGGTAKSFTVMVDTGAPLGAGATASIGRSASSTVLACLLPLGALSILGLGRRRFRHALHGKLGLLMALLTLGAVTTLSGCGSSFTIVDTPPGQYTFQIVGTGNTTHATQTLHVKLEVTK